MGSPTLLASSHKPTTLPTMTSQEPTSLPTITAVPEKSVQVVFQAGITLVGNMTAKEIPREGPELDQMVEVLTVAISDMLPCQSTVRIISIGGILINYDITRHLIVSEGLDISFEVILKEIL